MTPQLIINAALSLAVLVALFAVFRAACTGLGAADAPAAVEHDPTVVEESLPYAA
jgi:hypothetical protein